MWRTPTATAARFDFVDGLVAASDDAENLWMVGDDGAIVQTLVGSIPPGSAVVHRTPEDDVVALTGSGELHPAGYLRAQNASDLGVITVARVGNGPDTTLATVVGLDGELTPLKGDNYALTRQVGAETILTLLRWQSTGALPDDIPSWPDSFEVAAGSAGRMTATAIGESGDLNFALDRDRARVATVRLATLPSAASARTALELTTPQRADRTITAARGVCVLALIPDGNSLIDDEASLLDALFTAETSGACEE
ncbi:hypothetical protein [Microbacterium sp. SMR1]|uniref:hypothetical protein n=1 Tax=Microbacterium sp. SMR1 TaxID=1497340 RepID=UPI000DCEBCB7|nr:hypothetical protein [Microbacterium sp. SMR1]RAZ30725.1 hypothetical protein DO944_14475 [Microbacterium sp. SMR1]